MVTETTQPLWSYETCVKLRNKGFDETGIFAGATLREAKTNVSAFHFFLVKEERQNMAYFQLAFLFFLFYKIFKLKKLNINMKLTPNSLKINPEKVSKKIEEFIRKKFKESKKEGIVIGISGGLDSTVVLKLCINAIGKEKVIGVILTEKQGNPDAERYALFVAKKLGIKTRTIDISGSLKNLGVYNFPLSYLPGRKLKAFAVKKFINFYKSRHKKNPFFDSIAGKKNALVLKSRAGSYAKQRTRLVYLYYFADKNNLLAVGSAHRSEDLTGLFVKFGIDDNADLMPLKDLYRTQILEIARYLKIPEEIIRRTPNPDIIPGIDDKYKDLLGINYEVVDLILYGVEKGMKNEDIAKQLKINKGKVKKIREIIKNSFFLRNPSLYPKIN